MRRKRKTKDAGGRFTVEDRSSSSLGAMVAYAASLAYRERRDVYVREIGQQAPLFVCEHDDTDLTVTITSKGVSRV